MELYAPINKIIPFSLVDGPGSRCSIFLQGCNIACKYCHNPETQNLCCNCGTCITSCPVGALSFEGEQVLWDSKTCISCDTCIRVCPNHASPKIMLMSTAQIITQVVSYQPFIRGITVSGGECMLYAAWLTELFACAKDKGLGCLIDSNGTIPFSSYPNLMDVCDGIMLDVKAWDANVANKLTGQTARETATVKENLVYLSKTNKLAEVRIVVVDGYNDTEECIYGIAHTLGDAIGSTQLKLIRFRPYGVRGELANHPRPSDERMTQLEDIARASGFTNIVLT